MFDFCAFCNLAACVAQSLTVDLQSKFGWMASVGCVNFFTAKRQNPTLATETQASGCNPILANETHCNDQNPNLAVETQNTLKKSIDVHSNRSKIFLLYFYDAYDINLWKNNFGRSTAYSCRTNVFIESHHFM